MSGFFTRLAERQIADAPGVTPRLPSRFAPAPALEPEIETPDVGADPMTANPSVAPIVAMASEPAAAERPPAPPPPVAADRPAAAPAPAAAEIGVTAPERITAAAEPTPPDDPKRQETTVVKGLTHVRHETVESRPLVAATATREAVPLPRATVGRPPDVRRVDRPDPLVPPRAVPPVVPPTPAPETARADGDAPVVRVTIGRVEVRAAAPRQPVRERRAAARKALPLDEYLDRRHGARR